MVNPIGSIVPAALLSDFGQLTQKAIPPKEAPAETNPAAKFKYNHIYDVLIIPFRFEKFILWSFLLHLNALIYNLVILPLRVTLATSWLVWQNGCTLILLPTRKQRLKFKSKSYSYLTTRAQVDLARLVVAVVSSLVLYELTNPSVIYHWIRSQGNFKLYLLKAVFEIADLLLKGIGRAVIENLSREFQHKSEHWVGKFQATFCLTFYLVLHSFVLTMEMFVVHVVLTMSGESCFSFVFLNCFGELKISVFKKCDFAGLFQYACNDAVERLQVGIYFLSTLAFTSQDLRSVARRCAMMWLGELITDYIKHFFLTRLNNINIEFYIGMRCNLFQRVKLLSLMSEQTQAGECTEEVKFKQYSQQTGIEDKAMSHIEWDLLSPNVFDCESVLSMSTNFMILPHVCLLLRNIQYFCA